MVNTGGRESATVDSDAAAVLVIASPTLDDREARSRSLLEAVVVRRSRGKQSPSAQALGFAAGSPRTQPAASSIDRTSCPARREIIAQDVYGAIADALGFVTAQDLQRAIHYREIASLVGKYRGNVSQRFVCSYLHDLSSISDAGHARNWAMNLLQEGGSVKISQRDSTSHADRFT